MLDETRGDFSDEAEEPLHATQQQSPLQEWGAQSASAKPCCRTHAAAGQLEAGVSDEEVPCEGCEVWVARAREVTEQRVYGRQNGVWLVSLPEP